MYKYAFEVIYGWLPKELMAFEEAIEFYMRHTV